MMKKTIKLLLTGGLLLSPNLKATDLKEEKPQPSLILKLPQEVLQGNIYFEDLKSVQYKGDPDKYRKELNQVIKKWSLVCKDFHEIATDSIFLETVIPQKRALPHDLGKIIYLDLGKIITPQEYETIFSSGNLTNIRYFSAALPDAISLLSLKKNISQFGSFSKGEIILDGGKHDILKELINTKEREDTSDFDEFKVQGISIRTYLHLLKSLPCMKFCSDNSGLNYNSRSLLSEMDKYGSHNTNQWSYFLSRLKDFKISGLFVDNLRKYHKKFGDRYVNQLRHLTPNAEDFSYLTTLPENQFQEFYPFFIRMNGFSVRKRDLSSDTYETMTLDHKGYLLKKIWYSQWDSMIDAVSSFSFKKAVTPDAHETIWNSLLNIRPSQRMSMVTALNQLTDKMLISLPMKFHNKSQIDEKFITSLYQTFPSEKERNLFVNFLIEELRPGRLTYEDIEAFSGISEGEELSSIMNLLVRMKGFRFFDEEGPLGVKINSLKSIDLKSASVILQHISELEKSQELKSELLIFRAFQSIESKKWPWLTEAVNRIYPIAFISEDLMMFLNKKFDNGETCHKFVNLVAAHLKGEQVNIKELNLLSSLPLDSLDVFLTTLKESKGDSLRSTSLRTRIKNLMKQNGISKK